MPKLRWEYAEFGFGGTGDQDVREVWFSHRETWTDRPVDVSETLRELGDLGFELVNVVRYPKRHEGQLVFQQSRFSRRLIGFSMRMQATSSFYIFKRPMDDPEETNPDEGHDQRTRTSSPGRAADY
jgi:hypothetical protein